MKLNISPHSRPLIKRIHSVLDKYDKARKQIRGNSVSSVLLITPPTENVLPFSDEIAENYQTVFNSINFSTEKDCLVIPSSWFGTSRQREGYEPTKEIIALFLEQNFNAKFICIGGDGFAFLFGQGKKASDASITGLPLRLKELNHRPLYYMPYYSEFRVIDNLSKSERYFSEKNFTRINECMLHLMSSLSVFLRE